MRLLLSFTVLLLCSCGSGSADSAGTDVVEDVVTAPASLSGRTYLGTVSSGSGAFASTGTFTVAFTSASDYEITGDGTHTTSSSGTYTYSSSGAQGTASMSDFVLGSFTITLEFTSTDAGNYAADAGGGHEQSGTFSATSTILAPLGAG